MFDSEKIIFKNQHVSKYRVKWKIYTSNNFKCPTLIDRSFGACYSGILIKLLGDTKINRLATMFKIIPTSVTLTKEEGTQWIELCKENKLLPRYVNAEDCLKINRKGGLKEGHLVLNIKNQNQSIIYLYLDSFRKLRENPGFVKAIIHLCNEYNMNFYIAYVLSSHFNITGDGHHAIKVTNSIYSRTNQPIPETLKDKLNLKTVIRLYKFLHEKSSFEDTKIGKAYHWKCNSLISEIEAKNIIIPIEELLTSSKVPKILHSVLRRNAPLAIPSQESLMALQKHFLKEKIL